jgi:uncharacterized protein (TIGR04255 family)
MATNTNAIPSKLKQDFIVEVVFEVRFETTTLPEIFFGRLADHEPWKGFRQDPLPAYSIPPVLRQTDPNLRYQPVLQLSGEEGARSVRVGQQVASYHRMSPYVGWKQFGAELDEFFEGIFTKSENPKVSRLGIRYVNAAKEDVHGVGSLTDLNLQVTVADEQIRKSFNLNYMTEHPNDVQCVVRIASPDFVIGTLPSGSSLMIDVDVFTKPDFKAETATAVREWAESAHNVEKEQFFRLLKQDTKNALREE